MTELIKESNEISVAAIKSTEKSKLARAYGNKCFSMDRFSEALYHFTYGISFAENGSLDLAYAYGNRSAVLYEKGYFKECLQDIERALENNYPDDKKQKLLGRKNRALKNLHLSSSAQFHDPTPIIVNPSVENSSISSCLQIQKDPKYGRFVVATRDIEPGEILVVEEPYSHIILIDSAWQYCSECSERCFNMIPCTQCSVAMYCSEECRAKAFTEFHRFECESIQANVATYCLCARMTIKCVLERKFASSKSFSKQYKKIEKLMVHEGQKSPEKLRSAQDYIQNVLDVLMMNPAFLREIDLDDKKEFLKSLLLHNYLVLDLNTIKITNYDPLGSEPFGSAVYGYFSMFNHACSYNVGYSFYGKKIVLRALRKISKGEQCFVNYGCISYKMSKQFRIDLLQKNFYFTCQCRACEENWPTESSLLPIPTTALRRTSFNTLKSICDLIRSGSSISEKKRKEMLDKCFQIVEQLKKFEPCFEFSLIGYIYDSLLLGGNQSFEF